MIDALRRLVIESLILPRSAARRLIGLPLGYRESILAAAGVAAASAVQAALSQMIAPLDVPGLPGQLMSAPVALALLIFMAQVIPAGLATEIGRRLGGKGTHAAALRLMAWLQAMTVLLQILQTVLILSAPILGVLLALAASIWLIWAFGTFVAELHGFSSVLKVLIGAFTSVIVIALVASVALALAGVTPPEMRPADV